MSPALIPIGRKSIEKLGSTIREIGFGNALLYWIDRCCHGQGDRVRIYRYEFVAQPVAPRPLLSGARGRSIEVRPVAADDPALQQMPLTPDVIARRAGQGAVCFGAFKGEAMLGCLWLCLGPYEEDEVRCRFVPAPAGRACWDFDVYLRPEYRLGPGFARLWDAANAYLRERGVEWSVSRISAYNPRSLAAHSRLGIRRLGSAVFFRFGRVQLTVSSVPPKVHFSLGPGRIPVFMLDASPPAGEAPVGVASGVKTPQS